MRILFKLNIQISRRVDVIFSMNYNSSQHSIIIYQHLNQLFDKVQQSSETFINQAAVCTIHQCNLRRQSAVCICSQQFVTVFSYPQQFLSALNSIHLFSAVFISFQQFTFILSSLHQLSTVCICPHQFSTVYISPKQSLTDNSTFPIASFIKDKTVAETSCINCWTQSVRDRRGGDCVQGDAKVGVFLWELREILAYLGQIQGLPFYNLTFYDTDIH